MRLSPGWHTRNRSMCVCGIIRKLEAGAGKKGEGKGHGKHKEATRLHTHRGREGERTSEKVAPSPSG